MAIESLVNGTITIQNVTDPNLIYGTYVLAGITLFGVLLTFFLTRRSLNFTQKQLHETIRSNNLLSLEIKEKFKPQLSFTKGQIQYISDKTNTADFSCMITNTGNVSLSNIEIHYYRSSTKITLERLLMEEKEIKKTTYPIEGTFDPQRYHQMKLTFTEELKKEFWFAFWIDYEYLNGEKEESVALLGFTDLQYSKFLWHNHNDLQKARRNFKENKGVPTGL